MSNVLIGIIGVILFIGLALAGALFLGPRFQEATHGSKASAAVQALHQVASAVHMYETQTGSLVTQSTAGTTLATTTEASHKELVVGGYLKSVPGNPTNSGTIYVSREAGLPYVVMGVGIDDSSVCRQINRQAGSGDVDNVPKSTMTVNTGCHRSNGTNPTVYISWQRI